MKTLPIFKYTRFLFVLALALTPYFGKAQVQTAEDRATEITNRMHCELGLTEDQVKQVGQINLVAIKDIDAAKVNSSAREQMKKNIAIDKERDTKLRDVLTPEQFALYERLVIQDKEAMQETKACHKEVSLR